MGWADWMVVNQSLEEELELERNVRDVRNCSDEDALKRFACHWCGRTGIRPSC